MAEGGIVLALALTDYDFLVRAGSKFGSTDLFAQPMRQRRTRRELTERVALLSPFHIKRLPNRTDAFGTTELTMLRCGELL